jgi:hypothetical protein
MNCEPGFLPSRTKKKLKPKKAGFLAKNEHRDASDAGSFEC